MAVSLFEDDQVARAAIGAIKEDTAGARLRVDVGYIQAIGPSLQLDARAEPAPHLLGIDKVGEHYFGLSLRATRGRTIASPPDKQQAGARPALGSARVLPWNEPTLEVVQ